MTKIKIKVFTLFIFLSSPLYSYEIKPDDIKEHCLAFDGIWMQKCDQYNGSICTKYGKWTCFNRLEFQQRATKTGRFTKDEAQWCLARLGELKKSGQRYVCETDHSQGLKRYPAPFHMREEFDAYKKIVRSCLEGRDWKNEECRMINSSYDLISDYAYSDDKISTKESILYGHMEKIVNYITYNARGTAELKFIRSELIDYSKNLNSCQRSCLIKCSTSVMIDYEYDPFTKFSGISNCIGVGKGECTEFSRLAEYISDPPRTTVIIQLGDRHAYNKFLIDGKWYYGEPQDSNCTFYYPPEQQKSITSPLNYSKRVYDGTLGKREFSNFEEQSELNPPKRIQTGKTK
jgi:hypothetical protein